MSEPTETAQAAFDRLRATGQIVVGNCGDMSLGSISINGEQIVPKGWRLVVKNGNAKWERA